jgi:hypothetical protein
MNSSWVHISEDNPLLMNVINAETQLPENGDYLVEVKWPLTE